MTTARYRKTLSVVLLGILFAVSMVLGYIENLFPPLPMLPPGIKLGLSNIVVMYCLFFLSTKKAVLLVILKSIFTLFLRGFVAMLLSFTGGIFSILIMSILLMIYRERVSYLMISVCGGVFHNIGQFIIVSIMFRNFFVLAYLPVLILSGIAAGAVTALLLKTMLPLLKRLNLKV